MPEPTENLHEPRLTASNIKYLIAMLSLGGDTGNVRGTDIANLLGITKPSAHTMLCNLAKMDLVKKDRYGGASFTELGLATAERYAHYYEALKISFDDLFASGEEFFAPICAFLAEMSVEDLDRFVNGDFEQR